MNMSIAPETSMRSLGLACHLAAMSTGPKESTFPLIGRFALGGNLERFYDDRAARA